MEPGTGIDLAHPPSGTWYIPTPTGFTIGATTRSQAAVIVGLFLFVWIRATGKLLVRPFFEPQSRMLPANIFILYLVVSVFSIALLVMMIAGRVEIERDGDTGRV